MYFMRQLYKTYLSWASEQINREELRNQKCIMGTKRKKKINLIHEISLLCNKSQLYTGLEDKPQNQIKYLQHI